MATLQSQRIAHSFHNLERLKKLDYELYEDYREYRAARPWLAQSVDGIQSSEGERKV